MKEDQCLPSDDINNDIQSYLKSLETLIKHLNYKEEQVSSLWNFVNDEKRSLEAKIKIYLENGEIKTSRLPEDATNRLKRLVDEECKSLINLEFALFQKNIAQFILFLEY